MVLFQAVLAVVSIFSVVAIMWAAIGEDVADCINSFCEKHFPEVEE